MGCMVVTCTGGARCWSSRVHGVCEHGRCPFSHTWYRVTNTGGARCWASRLRSTGSACAAQLKFVMCVSMGGADAQCAQSWYNLDNTGGACGGQETVAYV
ncbi:hypothetical protein FGB62_9g26 [Gracilaria domingensis]|nr:hypothetical protein FGB62_9g26 [Gracilaria domingensis]